MFGVPYGELLICIFYMKLLFLNNQSVILMVLVVLHHTLQSLIPLLLNNLPFLRPIMLLLLPLHRPHQQPPLLLLLYLDDLRIGILIGPLNHQNLVAIERLVLHALLGELGHAPMGELDKCVALVREDVDVLDLAPEREVPEEDLVHLRDAVLGVWEFVVGDVDCAGLFGEGADAFHVLTVG